MVPKHPFARFLYYWVPPFLWMTFIFFLSSRHSVSVTRTFVYDFVIFKTLHIIEYSTLLFLVYRAFHSVKLPEIKQGWYAIILSVLFACTDEIHQLFTPSRTATLRDVLIDTAGIIITYILIRRFPKVFKRLL